LAVSGAVSNTFTNLQSGKIYFSNTFGDLIASDIYIGREGSEEEMYFEDSASRTIVLADAKVGFALQSNELFVDLP
jgi:hypothetical protein